MNITKKDKNKKQKKKQKKKDYFTEASVAF